MNRKEIKELYDRLKHSEKCAVTRAVMQYLESDGIRAKRNTLHYWREHSKEQSPLDGKYLEAFQYAFKTTVATPA